MRVRFPGWERPGSRTLVLAGAHTWRDRWSPGAVAFVYGAAVGIALATVITSGVVAELLWGKTGALAAAVTWVFVGFWAILRAIVKAERRMRA